MRLCWHSSIYRGQVFRILCFLFSCIFYFYFWYINPFQHSAVVSPPDALCWGSKFGLRVYRLKLTLFLQIVLGKLKIWHSFYLGDFGFIHWQSCKLLSILSTNKAVVNQMVRHDSTKSQNSFYEDTEGLLADWLPARYGFVSEEWWGWLWKAKMLWIKAGDISWPWCFLCIFYFFFTTNTVG